MTIQTTKPVTRVRLTRSIPSERVRLRRQRGIAIDRAMLDENLLGAGLGKSRTWSTWLAVLRAAFGLPLGEDDRDIFRQVAGDRKPPDQRVDELWCVLGRRSGKTRVAAATAVFIATMVEHRLSAGETGYVLILAASMSQAGAAFRYVQGFIEASPVLRQLLDGPPTASEIRLRNGIVISVHTNSYRTVRGRTIVAAIFDEVAFWRDETSATPDQEVYRAVLPSLAACGGILIGISSPYRKTGLLHQKWKQHYGVTGNDVLVIQGPTETFNPTLSRSVIEKAKANDPEAADSEWNGVFRNDLSSFLDDATIDRAIDDSRPIMLPPRRGVQYRAYTDSSGGRHDFFTLAIGHRDDEQLIVDVICAKKPPFDPHLVVKEYAALLREYGVNRVRGDAYAAAWAETEWMRAGITYDKAPLPKSQIYLECLPLWVRGLVSIPDDPTLLRELRLLERRTTRAGKDSVDHGRSGSDDSANSVCGVLHWLMNKSIYRYDVELCNIIATEEERKQSSAVRMIGMLDGPRFW